MRADRLLAALLLLQAKGKVTAAELATELEVSLATARRDLEALSTAGVPVYAERGRQGGWRLLGGARTDLSGLSAPEARSLFLLLGPAAVTSPQVASALRKLLHALPQTFRARAEAAADAILVDPARWGSELRDSFAAAVGHAHVQAVDTEGGHWQLQVTSASIAMLARQLAGWVPEVQVLGPPEVRAELARIGRRLTARYGDSGG